jgi:hypothetical protein
VIWGEHVSARPHEVADPRVPATRWRAQRSAPPWTASLRRAAWAGLQDSRASGDPRPRQGNQTLHAADGGTRMALAKRRCILPLQGLFASSWYLTSPAVVTSGRRASGRAVYWSRARSSGRGAVLMRPLRSGRGFAYPGKRESSISVRPWVGLLAYASVYPLAQQVGVAHVAGVLLDHSDQRLAK